MNSHTNNICLSIEEYITLLYRANQIGLSDTDKFVVLTEEQYKRILTTGDNWKRYAHIEALTDQEKLRLGIPAESERYKLYSLDKWLVEYREHQKRRIEQLENIAKAEERRKRLETAVQTLMQQKSLGFSDERLARMVVYDWIFSQGKMPEIARLLGIADLLKQDKN